MTEDRWFLLALITICIAVHRWVLRDRRAQLDAILALSPTEILALRGQDRPWPWRSALRQDRSGETFLVSMGVRTPLPTWALMLLSALGGVAGPGLVILGELISWWLSIAILILLVAVVHYLRTHPPRPRIRVSLDTHPLAPGQTARVRVTMPIASPEARLNVALVERWCHRSLDGHRDLWVPRVLRHINLEPTTPTEPNTARPHWEGLIRIPEDGANSYEDGRVRWQWGIAVVALEPNGRRTEDIQLFQVRR